MIEPQVQIVIAIILPLFAAAGINFFGAWKNVREIWQVVCACGQIAIIYTIYAGFMHDESYTATLIDILPDIDIGFRVEPLGLLFAGLASVLWLVSIIYSAGYLRANHDAHQTRFFIFFALTISGVVGLSFAGNLVSMYIFYELITLVTYPLVVHNGTYEAKHAGRAYLAYLLGGSLLFLLPAIAGTYYITGIADFKDGGMLFKADVSPYTVALLYSLYLFGAAKAAIMPMHRWLPKAMVAPAPVSGLLHAVAVVTAGVFVVGKVTLYVFGSDNIQMVSWLQDAIQYIAAATIIISGIFALKEHGIKRRLAYSTISNLGMVVLAFALLSKTGVAGAGLHMVSHAVGKITLFFISGALITILGVSSVRECNGLGKKYPLLFGCFFICSLSLCSLPYFAGGYSKEIMLLAAREEGTRWLLYLLYASMLISIAYLLPISYRAFLRPAGASSPQAKPGRHLLMKAGIVLTTLLTLAFPLYEGFITKMLEDILI